jgi:regulatory protein spx
MSEDTFIKVYGVKGCTRYRKVIDFLNVNKLLFSTINLTTDKIDPNDIKDMLVLVSNGFNDIVSENSAIFKQSNIDFNEMSFNDAISFIISHPQIIHRPIILQYYNSKPIRLLIGYNKNDINVLLRDDNKIYFSSNPCIFHHDE